MSALPHSSAGGIRGPYYCELCRLGCTGPAPWTQHLHSAKHLKMAAQSPDRRGHPAPGPIVHSDLPAAFYSVGSFTSKNIYCEVCQLSCSSSAPYKQHLESVKHIKTAARFKRSSQYISEDDGDGVIPPAKCRRRSSPGVGRVLQNAVYSQSPEPPSSPTIASEDIYCEVCRLSCSGPAPYKQHLDSAKHIKKIMQFGCSLREVISDSESGITSSDEYSTRPTASVDQVLQSVVTSDSPQSLHFASNAPYFCELCQLSCTGPAPYKQHLNSAKHIKMAVSRSMLQRSSAASPRASPSPGLDQDPAGLASPRHLCSRSSWSPTSSVPGGLASSPGASLPSSGAAVYLQSPEPPFSPMMGPGHDYFCKVCRVSCSGPAPFKQHLESVKHIKMAAHCEHQPPEVAENVDGSITLADADPPR
ncbi:zinc finger RNA-binding protein-like isoform X2 [Pollicipes pollicipes]|nr:zinc finger RNA-binding protein-like isoform X2 [Pollicipes pollicipes]